MKRLLIMFIALYSCVSFAQTQEEIDQLFKEGRYEEAVNLTKQRDSIAEQEKKLEKEAAAYVKDANWYINRKLYPSAVRMLAKAVSIYDKDKSYSSTLSAVEELSKNIVNENPLKRLSAGVLVGADFFSTNYGLHAGVSLKYGYYRDLVNVFLGVEYHLHESYTDRYISESGKKNLGTQITIPVAVKFNVARISPSCRFYVGVGLEYGVRLSCMDFYPGVYGDQNAKAMTLNTYAGSVHLGFAMRHFDVGMYYKGYFNDLIKEPYSRYMENSRVGMNVAYYF